MPKRSVILRLNDMIEAAERVCEVLRDVSVEGLEADWQRHWLVQRGIEILSEASRHLPDELKARHPEIPWTKVGAIGNVLRHGYEQVSAPILWKLVREDLPSLHKACCDELMLQQARNPPEEEHE
jgi:uncharacterized protein with HEPN domain